MSFSAKGQFGNGALNFQGNGGETQVRHLRQQKKKEPTEKQAKVRADTAFVVAAWKLLHFLDREHWGKILGDPRGYRLMLPYYTPRTGYHLFLRRNLSYMAWNQGCLLSPFSEMRAYPEVMATMETVVTF
jgi:hypothetical protein